MSHNGPVPDVVVVVDCFDAKFAAYTAHTRMACAYNHTPFKTANLGARLAPPPP